MPLKGFFLKTNMGFINEKIQGYFSNQIIFMIEFFRVQQQGKF